MFEFISLGNNKRSYVPEVPEGKAMVDTAFGVRNLGDTTAQLLDIAMARDAINNDADDAKARYAELDRRELALGMRPALLQL